MYKYIGHITEETWPEARSILDAFRATPDRYAEDVKGYTVWVEAGNLHTEPWREKLVQANWNSRVGWRVEGRS